MDKERARLGMIGRWKDKYYRDGELVEETEWTHNQIQNVAPIIAAGLFHRWDELPAGQVPVPFEGISYIAVGSGDVAWDALAPGTVPQDRADTTLTTEYYRQSILASDMSFLDADDPAHPVVAGPSRMIQIESTFLPADANGAMREFGLFCGFATGLPDSGHILNWIVHPLINKDATLTITRTIQIEFLEP